MKILTKNIYKIIIISEFIFLIPLSGFAINEDSLFTKLKSAKNDTSKINLLIEIGDLLRANNPDTSIYFYDEAINIAKKHDKENSRKYQTLMAKATRKIGMVYRDYDDYKKANTYYQAALKINLKLKNKKEIAECYNSLGVINYYQTNFKTALDYYNKSLKISTEIGDKTGMTYSYANLGSVNSDMGNYAEALNYFQKALDVSQKLNDPKRLIVCYNNIGIVYSHMGNYEKAIGFYIKSLNLSEKNNDLQSMLTCYNNLGSIYYVLGNPDKALEYCLKTLKIAEKAGSPNDLEDCYSNLGNAYKDKFEYTKAMDYYNKALKISLEIGDKNGMSVSYSNIGALLSEKEDYSGAIDYFKKSLVIDRQVEDKNGIAYDLGNISTLNISLATEAALSENQRIRYLNECIKYGIEAYNLAKEIKAIPIINDVAKSLKTAYADLGNMLKAYEFANIYIWSRDTLFNIEKNKVITEMEARYTSEKKQLEIEKLEKEKALQNETIARKVAENRKQQLVLYFFIGGFIIILIFSLTIYRLFTQKRKANILLAEQKHEIEEKNEELHQQNEEITTQRDEIEAQRDEITNQRDTVIKQKEVIENIHREQTDSIHYAKRIQRAVLPEMNVFSSFGIQHFVIFKPLNIVSGDFYWTAHIDNKLIFCVADCTGHGVPGAFMSMLGISLLNEIVKKEKVTDPAAILNQLRENIIESLQQQGKRGDQPSTLLLVQDGMDIALCVLDISTLKLQYAGANNPVYIIRNTPGSLSSLPKANQGEDKEVGHASSPLNMTYNLIELRPDKMPIAIYVKLDTFNNHDIQLSKGDMIYLLSDGFVDQFGGPKGRKFMYSNLKELILSINQKEINEQHFLIEQAHADWMKGYDQIDDISLLGIKI